MDKSVRENICSWCRIQQCSAAMMCWIVVTMIISSAGLVNSEAAPFTVKAKVSPGNPKPGDILNFECSYSLDREDVVLIYWVDLPAGLTIYTLSMSDTVIKKPTIGSNYTGRPYALDTDKPKSQTFKMNASGCDSARYKCSVWNVDHREVSSEVQVKVKDIKTPLVTQDGKVIQSVVIPENTVGPSRLAFKCEIAGATLPHTLNFTISENGTDRYSLSNKSREQKGKCQHSSVITKEIEANKGDKIEAVCLAVYSDGTVRSSQIPAFGCEKDMCRGNGHCKLNGTHFICICDKEYTGSSCEQEMNQVGAMAKVLQEPWFIGVIILIAVVIIIIIVVVIVLCVKKNKVRVATYDEDAKPPAVNNETGEHRKEEEAKEEKEEKEEENEKLGKETEKEEKDDEKGEQEEGKEEKTLKRQPSVGSDKESPPKEV